MSVGDRNLRQKIFVFSGFASATEFEKLELIHKLQSLGGFYYETESFKLSATHLITYQPSLSQKFLGACAAGKWILLPKYINDSFQAGCWLPENDYEWHEDNTVVNTGLPPCMYSAPRLCREKVTSQKAGMFSNWKVAVLLRDKRRRIAYTRILELGDAQIIKCKLEAENFIDIYKDLTFIFIERERIEATKILLSHEIPFVVPDYIRNFLLRDSPPSHHDFLITCYQPQLDYFIKFASSIYSGNTKHYVKTLLKPVIKKEEFKPEFIESITSCPKDVCSQNKESEIMNMEGTEDNSIENKDTNVTQELTLNCTIADAVKLPGLSQAVHKIARSEQRRENRQKCLVSNSPIRKKKFYRRRSNPPTSKTIYSYFKVDNNRVYQRYEDIINDSSKVSDTIKKKWKLHLQQRHCGLMLPPAYLLVEDRKFLESSEISSSVTALIESSLEEEGYADAMDIANSVLSHENYPPHCTLSDVAYKILQVAEEQIATKAYNFLQKVLYVHPPLDLESRQYYIKALFPSIGQEMLWKHMTGMINNTKFGYCYPTEIPQRAKRNQLLFSFIVTVLEQDFQIFLKSCSYPPIDIVKKDSRPLVVNIFWNSGEVGSANHNCRELFLLLGKSLSAYGKLEFQKSMLLCLQNLLTLVAECCQLSQKEQKVPEISPYVGPRCDKFALAFELACSGVLDSAENLAQLLTALEPQWLKAKVCMLLLDDHLTKCEFETGNEKMPLSLRKIVRQYMFTTPITRRHNDTGSFKEVEDTNCVQSREKLMTENNQSSEGKLLVDEKATAVSTSNSSEATSILTDDIKNCLNDDVESRTDNHFSSVNIEIPVRGPYLASIRLFTSKEVNKYLLLLLNLLLSYLEMCNIHDLVNLLRQIVAERKQILQNKQTAIPEGLQMTSAEKSLGSDANSKEEDRNEQGIIYNLLKKYLTYEPSLDTVITVADDLCIAQEFEKYQINFKEHLKTLCVENVNLPKTLLSAIQLITL